ncbi:hypothetical protein, conserved [Eimeria praecox]|uniref:Uncharacterized protein n=1 Tax=Eimeria praecox TaxID=51316 RepID=U6GYU6_9EIME|nr:hypothetical protein, conserved [Eimeria praecox]
MDGGCSSNSNEPDATREAVNPSNGNNCKTDHHTNSSATDSHSSTNKKCGCCKDSSGICNDSNCNSSNNNKNIEGSSTEVLGAGAARRRSCSPSSASDDVIVISPPTRGTASGSALTAVPAYLRSRRRRPSSSSSSSSSSKGKGSSSKTAGRPRRRPALTGRLHGWESSSNTSRSRSRRAGAAAGLTTLGVAAASTAEEAEDAAAAEAEAAAEAALEEEEIVAGGGAALGDGTARSVLAIPKSAAEAEDTFLRQERLIQERAINQSVWLFISCSPEEPFHSLGEAQVACQHSFYVIVSLWTWRSNGRPRRSRSPGYWTHDRFALRSPSPQRQRPQGEMWDTRLGQWKSRAGGIYIPPTPEEVQAAEEMQRTLRVQHRQLRSTSAVSGGLSPQRKRSPSLQVRRERGSPVYE